MNLWNVEAICPGDFSNDIALLKTASRNCLFVEVADDDLNLSDKVVQIGHPYGVMNQIISEGLISSLKGDGNTWNCSFASMPGNSGSPVFNEEWELVGISSRATYFSDSKTDSDLSRTWVVPLGYLKKILQDGKNNKNFHPIALSKEWESRCKFWSSTESKQARKLLAVNTLLSDSFEEPNPQKAAAIIVTEAERGSPEAINLLGVISYKGEGVPKDPEKAFKLWRESAEMGNTKAMNRLGTELGREGVASKNRGEALKWFQKAAEQGDACAQFNLGIAFFKGEGVAVDKVESVKWYRLAAEQGNANAQFNLGVAFYHGDGVSVNKVEGLKWIKLAAENGFPKAIAFLRFHHE
jgi:TPR repeat protein